MHKLVQGALDFHTRVLPQRRRHFAELADGQSPSALFVSCADSRVVPHLLASAEPGDLFVVRNVGNLVPCACEGPVKDVSVSAAITYATDVLGVDTAVVCGHSSCGAMRALHDGGITSPDIAAWLEAGLPSLAAAQCTTPSHPGLSSWDHLSQVNVLVQLENLRRHPSVEPRVARGELNLVAWWFDIGSGLVHSFDRASNAFRPILAEPLAAE